jgi:hypothetical protein
MSTIIDTTSKLNQLKREYKMQELTIKNDDKTSLPAFIAARDCAERNKKNRDNFTTAQFIMSTELYTLAVSAYTGSQVYRNFRQQFITIKVANPRMYDLISKEVEVLNEFCARNNVEIVKTARAVIYRIA